MSDVLPVTTLIALVKKKTHPAVGMRGWDSLSYLACSLIGLFIRPRGIATTDPATELGEHFDNKSFE